jgi:hypothetical protein
VSIEPRGVIKVGYGHNGPNFWSAASFRHLNYFNTATPAQTMIVLRLIAMTAGFKKELP